MKPMWDRRKQPLLLMVIGAALLITGFMPSQVEAQQTFFKQVTDQAGHLWALANPAAPGPKYPIWLDGKARTDLGTGADLVLVNGTAWFKEATDNSWWWYEFGVGWHFQANLPASTSTPSTTFFKQVTDQAKHVWALATPAVGGRYPIWLDGVPRTDLGSGIDLVLVSGTAWFKDPDNSWWWYEFGVGWHTQATLPSGSTTTSPPPPPPSPTSSPSTTFFKQVTDQAKHLWALATPAVGGRYPIWLDGVPRTDLGSGVDLVLVSGTAWFKDPDSSWWWYEFGVGWHTQATLPSGSISTSPPPPPPSPTGSATSTTGTGTGTVTVSWNPNSEADLAGYRIYVGTSSGNYAQVFDVGKATLSQLTLPRGFTYFFVVKAYDTTGNESSPSSELSKSVF